MTDFVPEPMIHSANPAFEALVAERATALCLAAPVSSHSMSAFAPCDVHLGAARQALLDRWLGQQDQVA